MLGRIRRNQQRRQAAGADAVEDSPSLHGGVGSLIGGSGVSLDGQSLMLPDDPMGGGAFQGDDGDEVSSINTSTYGGKESFRIIGSVEEPTVPPVPADTGIPASGNQEHNDASMEKVETAGGGARGGGGALCCGGGKGCVCVPDCLLDSPRWIKVVMALGLLLLVFAAVLIGVAAGLNNTNNKTGDGSASVSGSGPGDEAPVEPPVVAPTTAPVVLTEAPTNSPAPSIMPFPGQTPAPTTQPTLAPSLRPSEPLETAAPTTAPTLAPSGAPSGVVTETPTEDPGPSDTVVTFYATAGRFQGDDLEQLEEGLPNLPNDNEDSFLVHLGDWNSPFATSCDADSYTTVDQLYSGSSVPVFMVPGDNEYNDCPDPEDALQLWYDNLLNYDTKYWDALPFTVDRQSGFPENFAFVYEGILFVGINLVGGTIHDADEWSARQTADLEWIDQNFEANRNQIDLLVLFAHADPDIQSSEPFYDPFIDRVENSYNVRTIVIHRNLGIESSGVEPNYDGVDGLIVLVVEGSSWPPMKIELSAAGEFTFDQSSWYDDEVGR